MRHIHTKALLDVFPWIPPLGRIFTRSARARPRGRAKRSS